MNTATLTGTARLTRLALRRDRFTIPLWGLGPAAFTAATTALWADQFADPAALAQDTRFAAASPGIRLLGLASGATVGAYAMVRDYVMIAVLAALMSTFSVVRHTRQGEETGRAELLGAAVVGRHASLAAALVVTLVADLVLAALLAVGLVATGQPVIGSIVAGTAVAAVGVAFAGVAAVTSQLATSTRGASGLSAAVLGASFLASGVGNTAGHVEADGLRVVSTWPAWLSPIGWGQQMRPFGGDQWWPLGLAVATFLACTALAAVLIARRDLGHGMLPQRPGPTEASRSLRAPFGLAWRLQRGAFTGWAVGMLGFGLIMGGIIGQVRDSSGSGRDWYTQVGGSDQILDAYRASVLQMAAIATAIYVVQVLLRMRSEEADGPLESVLSAAISRPRWIAGHAMTALLGAVGLMALFAGGVGLAAGAVLGDPVEQVRGLVVAGLVQLPGVLVVGAAVVVMVGVLPRPAVGLSWVLLVGSILLGPLFGTSLKMPQWAQDLSPFTHVPKAPAVPVTVTPVLALVTVAVALAAAGVLSLRRRNLTLPA
jgi:ABC-2 type transport system permease protein